MQQGGLGRAGVLIECHNLLPLLPFNIHIFAPRPPQPLFVSKWRTEPASLLAKNL